MEAKNTQNVSIVDITSEPEELGVVFAIYHPALVPEQISSTLQLKPTLAHRKGEQTHSRLTKKAVARIASTGLWMLERREYGEAVDFDEQLSWLFKQLDGKEAMLGKLRDDGCDMQVRCSWYVASDNTVPSLSVEQMARLVVLGLPILFDVYLSCR